MRQISFIKIKNSQNHPAFQRIQYASEIDNVYASFYLTKGSVLKSCLNDLKYKNNKIIAKALSAWVATDLEKNFPISSVDFLIPVPLHPKKEQQRGYNQSLLLLQEVTLRFNIPIVEDALIRVLNTSSQTQLSRKERIENMSATFALNNYNQLRNKHILLFDDVLTTGATLLSCAQALLSIEGIRISLVSMCLAMDE